MTSMRRLGMSWDLWGLSDKFQDRRGRVGPLDPRRLSWPSRQLCSLSRMDNRIVKQGIDDRKTDEMRAELKDKINYLISMLGCALLGE